MATLTVWKFSTPEGAEQVLTKLTQLQKERLIEIKDAATVSWAVLGITKLFSAMKAQTLSLPELVPIRRYGGIMVLTI